MSAAAPLVSCVMPTHDRRSYVSHAIDYFQRQDYPHRELVVLDDGTDPVVDLIPDDPEIRYIRLEGRLTIGAKRNVAVEQARGDVIVHWDDDDWSAPERVSRQLESLTATGADICGLRDLVFYDWRSDRGWRYRYPNAGRPWVAGGTMCYRRELWERHPFPDVRQGEDTQFVWSRRELAVHALDEPNLYVALIHAENTSKKHTSGKRWTEIDGSEVREILGPDADRYRHPAVSKRRAPPAPINPPSRGAAAMASTRSTDHVVVSIPHAGPSDYLRQAVDSILGQTHENLTAIVGFDGDDSGRDRLEGIDDSRLVVHTTGGNHGRYFVDQIVLESSASELFLVQDSDDWSEPTRLERLLETLRENEADVCVSDIVAHDERSARRGVTVCGSSRVHEAIGPSFIHRAGHQGLYRTDALRGLGGWYGGYRIGFDTSILNLALLAGCRVTNVEEPLYHRRLRSGSLTSSSSTGFGTAERKRVVGRLRALHRDAYAATRRNTNGEAGDAIARLVRAGWQPGDEAALAAESDRLTRTLATTDGPGHTGGRAAPAPPPRRTPTIRTASRLPDVHEILAHEQARNPGWAVSRLGAIELYERLLLVRPRRVLDVGSGVSTAVIGAAAARVGAEVVSLEHDPRYAERTRRLLSDTGVAAEVNLLSAPLTPHTFRGGRAPWYDIELDGTFDFFAVDGPPLPAGGRAGAFPAIARHRARSWEFWLFDGDRPHEQECVETWSKHYRIRVSPEPIDETGVTIITPRSHSLADAAPIVDGLGISLLTGGRPDLLRQTVESLERRWPEQVRSAYVFALVNGPDEASMSIVRELGWVDRVVGYEPSVLGIGEATSFVMGAVAGRESVRTVLHLEDDWTTSTIDRRALARADELLADESVGQVRLRHRCEAVLAKHMVSGQAIRWRPVDDHTRADAHFTFNPGLTRASVADRVVPARSEGDAQRRFAATGLEVAQLSPGVFRHLGDRQSRR